MDFLDFLVFLDFLEILDFLFPPEGGDDEAGDVDDSVPSSIVKVLDLGLDIEGGVLGCGYANGIGVNGDGARLGMGCAMV